MSASLQCCFCGIVSDVKLRFTSVLKFVVYFVSLSVLILSKFFFWLNGYHLSRIFFGV